VLASELDQKQADLDRALARVAELRHSLTELIQHYSETWDLPILQRAEAAKDGATDAFILRKQAKAVEPAIRTALRNLGNPDISEDDIAKFASDYATRLRQQADQQENTNESD
jgi:hypothetical protein